MDLRVQACRRHYPGGPLGRIARGTAYSSRFLARQRLRPSPPSCRVGVHIGRFEACSTFTRVTACLLAASPKRRIYLEGSDGFVTSTAAPIATGWSDPVAGWELHPLKTNTFARRTTRSDPVGPVRVRPRRSHPDRIVTAPPAAVRDPTDITRPSVGSPAVGRNESARRTDPPDGSRGQPRPAERPSIGASSPHHHQCVERHHGRISGTAWVRESHARTVSGCPGPSQIGQGSKQNLGSFAEQAWMQEAIYPSLNPSPSFLSRVYFFRRPAFVKGVHRFLAEVATECARVCPQVRPGSRVGRAFQPDSEAFDGLESPTYLFGPPSGTDSRKLIPGRGRGAEVVRRAPQPPFFLPIWQGGSNLPGSPRLSPPCSTRPTNSPTGLPDAGEPLRLAEAPA